MPGLTERLEFRVGNLDCDHDAAVVKRGLISTPGVIDLKVYPKASKLAVTYDPSVTNPVALQTNLDDLGFPVLRDTSLASPLKPWRNPKILTSLASGLLLLIGWLLGILGLPAAVSGVLYGLAIVVGAYFFGREAVEELLHERRVGIELLMSVAALVAAVMGQVAEGATLAFLYSISEAAEGYTEEKTRSAIKALMSLAPKTAWIRRDGQEAEIPVETLSVGDVFIARPGQAIATDGEVLIGTSEVNQAPVTGESVPVEKAPGDPVFAGTMNGEGVLEVRATKTFADNTLARIIHLVEEAQEQKGKSQRFIERFGARYSPIVLLVGFLIAVAPPVLLGAAWTTWITRATVFIVAAAPCALVISIPITLVAALGTGARRGVLIKGGVYVEELAKIQVVALDKTGTLTRGEPEVTDVLLCAAPGSDAPKTSEAMIAIAAGVERWNTHPIARAILQRAEQPGIPPVELTEFQSLTAAGAAANMDGRTVYVGSPDLFRSRLGVKLDRVEDDITRLQGEGKTLVLVGDAKAPWGVIALRDAIRPRARAAIDALRKEGVRRIVMLTGDNALTADAIARELGIDEVHAGLSPEGKVAKVRELAQHHGHVAMVGDGVNDAPALAAATVGVAMGAAGTDVALETADVALMGDDLERISYALHLAKRNQRVVQQNLWLSGFVISVLVIGAIGGWLTLPLAVLGHEISEFVVIGSGLRMLRA